MLAPRRKLEVHGGSFQSSLRAHSSSTKPRNPGPSLCASDLAVLLSPPPSDPSFNFLLFLKQSPQPLPSRSTHMCPALHSLFFAVGCCEDPSVSDQDTPTDQSLALEQGCLPRLGVGFTLSTFQDLGALSSGEPCIRKEKGGSPPSMSEPQPGKPLWVQMDTQASSSAYRLLCLQQISFQHPLEQGHMATHVSSLRPENNQHHASTHVYRSSRHPHTQIQPCLTGNKNLFRSHAPKGNSTHSFTTSCYLYSLPRKLPSPQAHHRHPHTHVSSGAHSESSNPYPTEGPGWWYLLLSPAHAPISRSRRIHGWIAQGGGRPMVASEE